MPSAAQTLTDPGSSSDRPSSSVLSSERPDSLTAYLDSCRDDFAPQSPIPSFRHSHWAARRAKISESLHQSGSSSRRIKAFNECGSKFWIQRNRHRPDELRAVAAYCHDRFCDVCSQQRAFTIRSNANRFIEDHAHRTLDLTIRSTGQPLRQLVTKITRSFKLLRKTELWRTSVRGGAAFLEITWNPGGTGWHPHLHLIIDSLWMDQPDLQKLWYEITGDSYIVFIKLIEDRRRAAGYIAKYASKQFPSNVIYDPDLLREAMDLLKGRRLIIQFGTWSNFKFLHRDPNPDWETLCPSSEIYSTSKLNSTDRIRARALVIVLESSDPLLPATSRSPPLIEDVYDDRPTRTVPEMQRRLFTREHGTHPKSSLASSAWPQLL